MKGIPPEIDRIMWTIAEDGNHGAADEFVQRYPLYREELLRRRETVSRLKTSGKRVKSETIPKFVPTESIRTAPAPRQVAIVSALVLAALAAASYTITSLAAPPPKPEQILAPGGSSPSNVAPKLEPRKPESPIAKSNPDTSEAVVSHQTQTPEYLKPQTLVLKKAALVDALRLIASQAKVRIEIAPGMPNPTIALEYRDTNAIEMLKDLGSKYGFTPFDQGDGSIVVYPAVDPSGTSAGPSNARRVGG
ncbi:hypothetical protein [Fimbriimonas ginsengisoli]|uniref:Uncharacterized protein n=1 Tax=Fimbriimonas ginsengisoli Gsoil 348 TaxID=661478 RepID=A0A068NWX6_FIMGI|nr:hypothetical protein [Fimbriimonas ginsengisoli]AIE87872.1 hypothetical protein OP10G_4504 [Fimbriimonas ginsengisoli Gsoil 348]